MTTTTSRRARATTTRKAGPVRSPSPGRAIAVDTPTPAPKVTARLAQRARGIQRRRKKLGLSLNEIARRAGCSVTMIGNLERGQIPQKSAALPRILEVLDEAEKG